MAKLLETKLPVAIGPIDSAVFNRLVDVGATVNVNETEKNINQFAEGSIVWNRATQQLQLWVGKKWVNIYKGSESGVEGVSQLGTVSVSTGGATTIIIGTVATGYGTEQWYT